MLKKISLSILLSVSLTCYITPLLAIELAPYSKIDTVSGIINDKAVTRDLKETLGKDYETFINNYDVFGEPRTTAGDGLFVEGWLKDLYLENASALVIKPDGKVYTAWVVPASDVINYKASDNDSIINADILQWAKRFKNMRFTTNKLRDSGSIGKEYFNTQSFSIELTTVCSSNGDCNDASYYGERKKDGATLTLQGKAARAHCEKSLCPIISYKFENSSTIYMLSKIDDSLTVIQGGKILMTQKGKWGK